jgi:hypothetical protein
MAMATVEEIDRVFAPFAEAVDNFAWRNRLKLEKCARGNSGWELSQSHRVGGTVYLLLMYDPEAGLGIGSVWQFPCPEMSLLYSHFRKLSAVPLSADSVLSMLKAEAEAIMKVKFGYWTHLQPLEND